MLLCIAYFNIWIICIIGIFFVFMYDPYYEIIFWGICFDGLYNVHIATIASVLIFYLAFFLKKRLSWYA